MTAISRLEESWGLPPDVSASMEASLAWPPLGTRDTSITSGARVADLFQRIFIALTDADDAVLIEASTIEFALIFAKLLPPGLPLPDVCVEDDGYVEFEWYFGPRQVLSVSVRRDGFITWAVLAGTARHHGWDTLLQGVPRRIIEYIDMVSR